MTKAQMIAQKTNETNKCAKIAGLSYSRFSKTYSITRKQWPHKTMQDLSEDINCLFNNPDLFNANDYSPKEIASFVMDLWEVTQ